MTSMNHDVTHIFNKFAGVEIAVKEEKKEMTIGGKKYEFVEADFENPNDPVLLGMEETAKKNNLSLRVWLPGTFGTMDYRLDRANVNVAKDPDGKWRVGKQFTLG